MNRYFLIHNISHHPSSHSAHIHLDNFNFKELEGSIMPNIFPQISFFTTGLSSFLMAFSPQKVKKMVTFFPVAAAPFASTKVAKTLSRSSLNRIKVFPLSSRQTSEEEDCEVFSQQLPDTFLLLNLLKQNGFR